MPLSAFTQYQMGGGKPLAARIYESLVESLGDQFDLTVGGHLEACLFAEARGLARTSRLLDHATSQRIPRYALELLPALEDEYGIVPSPRSTITERRAELAARKLLPGGAVRLNVETSLQTLLGDDFIAYRTTQPDEIVTAPTSAGAQPMNLVSPTTPRKLITLIDGASVGLGTPQTFRYDALDTTGATETVTVGEVTKEITSTALLVGDVVVFDPGRLGWQERVTVEETGINFGVGDAPAYRSFVATFDKAHGIGTIGTTQPWPYWVSSQRHALIVVSPDAAVDAEKRRKIHELMKRLARGVSTWNITDSEDGELTTGPFRVGVGRIGVTTIGEVEI